jgi:hypothetical protein
MEHGYNKEPVTACHKLPFMLGSAGWGFHLFDRDSLCTHNCKGYIHHVVRSSKEHSAICSVLIVVFQYFKSFSFAALLRAPQGIVDCPQHRDSACYWCLLYQPSGQSVSITWETSTPSVMEPCSVQLHGKAFNTAPSLFCGVVFGLLHCIRYILNSEVSWPAGMLSPASWVPWHLLVTYYFWYALSCSTLVSHTSDLWLDSSSMGNV